MGGEEKQTVTHLKGWPPSPLLFYCGHSYRALFIGAEKYIGGKLWGKCDGEPNPLAPFPIGEWGEREIKEKVGGNPLEGLVEKVS